VNNRSLTVGTWNVLGRRVYPTGRTAEPGTVRTILRDHPMDVLSLQEIHFYDGQPDHQLIGELRDAGFEHFVGQPLSASHLDRAAQLGVGVASRYPLIGRKPIRLNRPELRARVRGEQWVLHDKGMVGCALALGGDQALWVYSLHLFPFFEFGVGESDDRVNRMWEEFWQQADQLAAQADLVLAGDFNHQRREPAAERFSGRRWRFCLGSAETTMNGLSLDDIALSWSPPAAPRTELIQTFSDHRLAIAHVQLRDRASSEPAGRGLLRGARSR
jgi:endonuclease/exonuclease/phosphatase family metal-dependent hydrolase